MDIAQKVSEFFKSLIPVQVITRWNSLRQPRAVAPAMDAAAVANIIRDAEVGNTRNLFALYRDLMFDSHILAEFSKRLSAMLGDQINVQPADEAVAEDAALAKSCHRMIKQSRDWFDAMKHLLTACLWPVAVVEKVWRPATTPGLTYELYRLKPVPAQLLNFSMGYLRIADVDEQGNMTGTFHLPDPRSYIVHRGHLMPTDDNWGGPMRAILFWWLLKTQTVGWWARFLERYQPIFVGKFRGGDDRARLVLENAFSTAHKLGGIVINTETEFDVKQSLQAANVEGFEKFHAICAREISKIITGHAMSQESSAGGINDGEAKGKELVRQDIRQLDSILLGATVKQQLFDDFKRYNNLPGELPEVWWGAESFEEASATADVLFKSSQAGLEPTDDALPVLSKRLGFALRRKAAMPAPALGGGLATLSADARYALADHPAAAANEAICREAAPGLAVAFRGIHAPIRRFILDSTGDADLERRIRLHFADWSEARLQPIIASAQDALKSVAANGAASAVTARN